MSDPITLAAVIAQVESGSKDNELRFESGLYSAWQIPTPARDAITTTIRAIHDCSRDTAHMIACTSWGRYQILGENLYSAVCGCKLDIFAYVADTEFQRICFEEFLRNRGVDFSFEDILADAGKRQQFIAAYNGPGAVDAYWGQMKAAVAFLSKSAEA